MTAKPYRIDAILFDFDGTLTQPGSLDFSVIKRTIGCPETMPVLEYMAGIEDDARRVEMARYEARHVLVARRPGGSGVVRTASTMPG